jgi:hypothetical protein
MPQSPEGGFMITLPLIVGIAGRIGSGKSTAANYLIEQGFILHKMAGPLKNMLRCLGLDDRHIEGDLKELPTDLLCGHSPRFAMQTIGTAWGRDTMAPDFWVNAWKNMLPVGSVVCDDVRFSNEVEAIHSLGGKVIRIVRDELETFGHISEAQDFGVDYTIGNSGTIDDLSHNIDRIISLDIAPTIALTVKST